MRFRSQLLQPPGDDSEPTLSKIYPIYRTPAGHLEGQEEDIAEMLERDSAHLSNLGIRPKPRSKIRGS
jgi:hypothetical protein